MECRSWSCFRRAQKCTQLSSSVEDAGPQTDICNRLWCIWVGSGSGDITERSTDRLFSKALAEEALAKSNNEKELMVLVRAIHHWKHYLLGRKFTVLMDINPWKVCWSNVLPLQTNNIGWPSYWVLSLRSSLNQEFLKERQMRCAVSSYRYGWIGKQYIRQ